MTLEDGSKAPGEQYSFFGALNGESYNKLSDFSVTLMTGGNFHECESSKIGNQSLATVTAPGDSDATLTGYIYNDGGSGNATWMNMLTFKVTNPDVTSFEVWILDSNVSEDWNQNAAIGISVNGGAAVTHTTVQAPSALEWTQFTITGASPSDVFTVSVQSDSDSAKRTLGGITFKR